LKAGGDGKGKLKKNEWDGVSKRNLQESKRISIQMIGHEYEEENSIKRRLNGFVMVIIGI
jgi:hypothetical protein